MALKSSLEQKFAEPVTCYGHCDQPAGFRIVSDQPLIACYHCMAGYASRIMTYGTELDIPGFKAFISKAIGNLGPVQDEDIRIATRHVWDSPDLTGGEGVKAAYWTQNYRRTKVDDPNRAALFICGNCGSFFIQSITGRSALCDNCRPPGSSS
jgi:hypothetical protein